MIDIDQVRDNFKATSESLARRGVSLEQMKELRDEDEVWRELTDKVDKLRAQQNAANQKVASTRDADREEMLIELRKTAEELKKMELDLVEVAKRREKAWRRLPNLPDASVPDGGADDFEVVRMVPEKIAEKTFERLDYFDLGEGQLFNLTEASRVSGSRFAYIIGDLARLQLALVSWVFDELRKDDFVPIIPPVLISEKAMAAMGYLDQQADEIYKTQDDLYLVGTSEQAIGPMHTRKKYDQLKSPKRYVGYSSCFRREAGSHGKDVRGLMRMHQFEKIEMFSFVHPDKSSEEHEFILSKQEQIMKALELPYRVIKLAAGDLGSPSAMTYDIESWIPSQQRYRETHSCSNTTDYQARRLNIRVKDELGTRKVHMLNGTAIAMGRTFIALLENHQQADGSVKIPEALHPYVPFKEIKKPDSP